MLARAGNGEDVELLQSDPHRLILRYSDTVRVIVKKYISLGMFQPSEFDDVVQTVLESLLRKIPSMQRQYNGTVLFVTYLSSIVRNVCLALRKSSTRRVRTTRLHEMAASDSEVMGDVRLIDEYVKRLTKILLLYDRKLPKVLFGLKLWYRLPITLADLQSWYPAGAESDRGLILRSFGTYYEHMRDSELYWRASPVLNRLEGKSTKPDSLRRFVAMTIRDILSLMNGSPPRYRFDEDSLSVLIEHYFFRI